MTIAKYITEIEPIKLKDELGEFLGTFEDGLVEIHYSEIVKMAGHSCATVSGAWLLTKTALEYLYPDDIPQRGNIKVEIRDDAEDGSVGVTASVISNICGAGGPTGFNGLAGKYIRRNLLSFGVQMEGFVRFTRTDNGNSIEMKYRPANIVHPSNLLMTAIGPKATNESRKEFPTKWAEMVATILSNPDKVIEVIK